jgi:putative transposase
VRISANPLDSSFCVEALEEAIARYGIPEIFNSDQGSQFTSEAFMSIRESRGGRISMDCRGRWTDNILMEQLCRSVKYEEAYLKAYGSIAEARRELGKYFEFYNQRRRHRGVDDRTPDEACRDMLPQERLAA